jgi:hypothetical protein
MPVLRSQKNCNVAATIVSSSFANDLNNLPALFISFRNKSRSSIDFSTDNLSATSGGSKVKIYTYEELERIIQQQAAAMAFATAMSAASQTMAASMPQTTYSSGTASAYGSGGYAYGSYSGASTTYNPAATSAAVSQINSNAANQMRGIAETRDAQVVNLSEILRRNTVRPGEAVGGLVKFKNSDLKTGKPFRLVATVNGENHEFLFEVGK